MGDWGRAFVKTIQCGTSTDRREDEGGKNGIITTRPLRIMIVMGIIQCGMGWGGTDLNGVAALDEVQSSYGHGRLRQCL